MNWQRHTMKDHFVLVVVAWLVPAILLAQDQEESIHAVSVLYGLNQITRQDQLFSPMVYQDVSFRNITVRYVNENTNRCHTAEIFYAGYEAQWHETYTYLTGTDNEVQSTSPTFITLVGARYSFLKKMHVTKQGSWAFGGITDNQINAVDNVYGAFGTFGYLGQFSVSPMVRRQFVRERHELLLSAFFPIISWISRSPYALNDDEYIKNNADHNGFKTVFRYIGDGNIQTINNFQKINFHAAYSYRLSERWKLGGLYGMELLRSAEPKPLIALRNNFNVLITFGF